jgi:ankyrin repeat protein
LHVAAYYGHAPVIDFLLGLGADFNVMSIDGASPLNLAVHQNRTDCEVALRAAGKEVVSPQAGLVITNYRWPTLRVAGASTAPPDPASAASAADAAAFHAAKAAGETPISGPVKRALANKRAKAGEVD